VNRQAPSQLIPDGNLSEPQLVETVRHSGTGRESAAGHQLDVIIVVGDLRCDSGCVRPIDSVGLFVGP
jgi:hypothetical protein